MKLDSKGTQSKPRSLEEGPVRLTPENPAVTRVQSDFKYRQCIGIIKFILYLELVLLVGWIGGIFISNYYQHRQIDSRVTIEVAGVEDTDDKTQSPLTVNDSEISEDDTSEERKIDEVDSDENNVSLTGLRFGVDENGLITLLQSLRWRGGKLPASKDPYDEVEIESSKENDPEYTTVPTVISTDTNEEDERNKEEKAAVDDDVSGTVSRSRSVYGGFNERSDLMEDGRDLVGDGIIESYGDYSPDFGYDRDSIVFPTETDFGGHGRDSIVFPTKSDFDSPNDEIPAFSRPLNPDDDILVRPSDLSDDFGHVDDDGLGHRLSQNDYFDEVERVAKRSTNDSSEEKDGANKSTSSASSEEQQQGNTTTRALVKRSNKDDDSSSSSSSSEEKPEDKPEEKKSSSSSSSSSSSEENGDEKDNSKHPSSNEDTNGKDCSTVNYYRSKRHVGKKPIDVNNLGDEFVKLDSKNPTLQCEESNTVIAVNSCGQVSYLCQ